MHRAALTIAIVSFFALAGIAQLSGVGPWTCASRAAIGAAIVYVLAMIAMRLALSIFVNAIMAQQPTQQARKDPNEFGQ